MRNYLQFFFLFLVFTVTAQDLRLVLPVGHTKSITCLAVSKDNKRIVSGSEDGTLRLWDISSGKELMVYKGHYGSISQIQYAQNDQRILSIAEDNTLKVWDLKSGNLVQNLEGHTEMINKFSVSPDEKLVSTVGEDRLINVYRLADGQLLSSKTYFDWGAENVLFDSTGTRILTYDDDRFIVYSIPGDTLQLDAKMSIQQSLKLPESNKVALSLFMHNHYFVIDFTRNEFKKVQSQFNEIVQMESSNSGEMLIIGNGKDSIELWNLKDYSKKFTLVVEDLGESSISHISFNSDDQKIFLTDFTGKTFVYASSNGELLYTTQDPASISCLSFPDNCELYASGLRDNSIQLRNVRDGKLRQRILGKSNSVLQMNMADSSEVMISIIASAQKNSIMTDAGKIRLAGVDKNTGKLMYQIDRPDSDLGSYRGNDLYFTFIDEQGLLILYKRETGEILLEHPLRLEGFVDNFFNEKEKDLLEIYYADGKVERINCTDNSVKEYKLGAEKVKKLLPFGDGNTIWCIDSTNTVLLIDLEGNEIKFRKSFGKKDEVMFINGSNTSFLVVGTKKMSYYAHNNPGVSGVVLGYKRITDAPHKFYSEDHKLVDMRDFIFNDAQLNGSGSVLKIRLDHTSVQFFDVKSGQMLREMKIDAFADGSMSYCTFIEDKICHFIPKTDENDKDVVAQSNGQQFKFIYEDVLEPTNALFLEGHTFVGMDTKYSDDSDFFITSAWDGTSIFWNKRNGKKLATSMILDNDNWITFLPSGYYYCSKDASKFLHYVDSALNVVTFEQLDTKFNRPDLVLKALKSKDSLNINAFHNAYLKRIRRLEMDTTAFTDNFSLPKLSFENRELLTYQNAQQEFILDIRAADKLAKLDRFNVWINEVPLFGERGYSLADRRTNFFDTTIVVQLSEGENRIEASVTNTNAIESFRSPLYVTYTSENPYTPKTHFIGIGIDKFSEPGHDLSYSVKDIGDLAKALKKKLGNQLTIDTLFNENVSVSNVQALKKKLLQTNINDKVIISYSGHGLLNEEYDYFLSAYNVDFHHPENGGIPYEVLEDLLDSIPARKKLLLIDACHSGEVDKDDFKEMVAVAGAKGIVKPKGGDTENTSDGPTLGLQNSFQLMQELFVNVQKGSGATIISAAAGNQFALEGGKLENGFFTYAILQYMKDHDEVSINALKKYVYSEVEKLSGGMQKPTSRIENLEMDWRVW